MIKAKGQAEYYRCELEMALAREISRLKELYDTKKIQGIELMHLIKKGQIVSGDSQNLSAAGQFYSLVA